MAAFLLLSVPSLSVPLLFLSARPVAVAVSVATLLILTVTIPLFITGVSHPRRAVLPLSLSLVRSFSGPLSVLVPLVVSTGIVIPGFGVVHHRRPGRRHTSSHGWRISTLGKRIRGSRTSIITSRVTAIQSGNDGRRGPAGWRRKTRRWDSDGQPQ